MCFSPRKHKIFTDYSGKKSSIRVKKFNADTSSNTNDMLMGDTVIVEHYPQLDSPDQRFNLQPRFQQSNQCLKAKVTNMSKEEMAGDLTLMNCTLNSYFSCFKCNKKTRTIYCSHIFRVQKLPLHPLTPKISLVILLTVCHTVLMMLVWRIWYWINLYSLNL